MPHGAAGSHHISLLKGNSNESCDADAFQLHVSLLFINMHGEQRVRNSL